MSYHASEEAEMNTAAESQETIATIGGKFRARLAAARRAKAESALVRLAAPVRAETMVLIEPGAGAGLGAAVEKAGLVIGIQNSTMSRQLAEQEAREHATAGRVSLCTGSAEHTGLDTAIADIVLACSGIELWADRARALAELHRILRADGRLLLCAPEDAISQRELDAAVRATGFHDVQSWRFRGSFGSIWVQLRAVA